MRTKKVAIRGAVERRPPWPTLPPAKLAAHAALPAVLGGRHGYLRSAGGEMELQ